MVLVMPHLYVEHEQHLLMGKDTMVAQSSAKDRYTSYTLLQLKLMDTISLLK